MSTKKQDYEISLLHDCLIEKGCGIADIFGYVSHEFGDPVFKITKLILSPDRVVYVEGEHDHPYLSNDDGLMRLPENEDES